MMLKAKNTGCHRWHQCVQYGSWHPEVVQAIKDQADRFLHILVYGELIQSPQVGMRICLLSIFLRICNPFFTNSGTEATEAP
jgi:acetylornithine/succinyldiaminopimelate/putrescine aminotransferase